MEVIIGLTNRAVFPTLPDLDGLQVLVFLMLPARSMVDVTRMFDG